MSPAKFRPRPGFVLAIALLLILSVLVWRMGPRSGPGRNETGLSGEEPRTTGTPRQNLSNLTITVLYDNNEYDERLKADWGFSCLIQGLEKVVLFDTGANGQILLSNMHILGIDPKIVQVVVISHIHGDHVGGLVDFLKRNHDVDVWLPQSFPEDLKKKVRSSGARLVEVDGPREIFPRAYSTGEIQAFVKEQSLVIATAKGLVVITGCSHPGILNIIRRAEAQLDQRVYLVIGGFHLVGMDTKSIRQIVQGFEEEGVSIVAPFHCSGDAAREVFKEAYGEGCILAGVGYTVKV